MRFIAMVRANPVSESGALPAPECLKAMMAFNEEMVKAGVMLAGEGLQPSAKGARIRYGLDDKRTVIDGPFAETKELIAGFWMLKCASKEEAIAWIKRCPHPFPGHEGEIEIRQVFDPEDFAACDPAGEVREKEVALRAQLA